jgi:uncharacterized protein YuzB (UPF0349 family)
MFKKFFSREKTATKHHLEICLSNEAYDHPDFFPHILALDDVDIEEVGCNSYCEFCDVTPYVILNAEVIKASTPRELFEKVSTYLNE